jgi:hypothetical protein
MSLSEDDVLEWGTDWETEAEDKDSPSVKQQRRDSQDPNQGVCDCEALNYSLWFRAQKQAWVSWRTYGGPPRKEVKNNQDRCYLLNTFYVPLCWVFCKQDRKWRPRETKPVSGKPHSKEGGRKG